MLSHTDPPITDPDSIELLNTGTSAIDIGGWYLSDAASQPFKYRIPDGTRLQPGQYIVFDETHFNPTPLTPAPHHFSLNGAQGDDVWLTIAGSNGAVLSFVDDVHFPATANGESLGRVPDGQGVLAPQQFVTLGSTNAAPRVGPLIISEVQYHPSAPSEAALAQAPDVTVDDLEFVEIANPTAQAVSLRAVAHPRRDRLRFRRRGPVGRGAVAGRGLVRPLVGCRGCAAAGVSNPIRAGRLRDDSGAL